MAFPTTVYLNDATILSTTSDQRFPLGTRGITSDGRVFRYTLSGGIIPQGRVCLQAADHEWMCSTAMNLTTDQGTITSTWGSVSVNSSWCVLTGATGVLVNEFKDGYFITAGTTGGQIVRITSNTTGSTAAGQSVTFTFGTNSRLSASITTGQEVMAMRSPYYKAVVSTSTIALAVPVAGVSPVAVASGKYFWLQTWGLCGVRANVALVVGVQVATSSDAASTGEVGLSTELGVKAPIGYCISRGIGTALETEVIMLQLCP